MLGTVKAVLHERLEHWIFILGDWTLVSVLALVEAESLQTTPLHALQ